MAQRHWSVRVRQDWTPFFGHRWRTGSFDIFRIGIEVADWKKQAFDRTYLIVTVLGFTLVVCRGVPISENLAAKQRTEG